MSKWYDKFVDPIAAYLDFVGYGNAAAKVAGKYLSKYSQERKRKEQEQSARDWDYQMWKESNRYNSPRQQMMRLRAAGLNPYLIYGSGSSSGGTTSPIKADRPLMNDILAGQTNLNPLGMLDKFNDLRVRNAQVNNIEANTELLDQRNINEGIKAFNYSQDYLTKKQKYDITNDIRKSIVNKAKSVAMKEGYNAMGAKLQYEMDATLKEYNLTSRDKPWLRLFMLGMKNGWFSSPTLDSGFGVLRGLHSY